MNRQLGEGGAPVRARFCVLAMAWLCTASTAWGQQPGTDLLAFKASGQGRSRLADAAGVFNEFIAGQVSSSGRYNFGAFPAGGANLAGSQSFNLSYSWPGGPGTSYTTIRLNGLDMVFGDGQLPITSGPVNEGDDSTTVAANSQLQVTQTLSIVNGPNSGRADTIKIRYTLLNLGTESLNLGLRIMIDTMLNGNDAAPFRVPGIGAITTERMFEGPAVPSFWQAFQDLANPDIAAQGTLTGSGAVSPTRFALASWGRIQSSLYDFVANPQQQTGDSGIGVWWDDMVLPAAETIELVTFYGLGDQTVAQGSVLLGVSAPTDVNVAQPTFQIAATVENPSLSEIRSDVIVDLFLPEGFTVINPAVRSEVGVGDLAPGQGAAVVYEVDATGVTPGTYVFTVQAGPRDDPNPVSLTRQLRVSGNGPPPPDDVVDPAQSRFLIDPNSPVDPSTGLAPLGVPLELIAELNDANGVPLAGIDAARVTYVVTPPEAASVTPGGAPSDDAGGVFASLVGLARGPVSITAAFDGTPFGAPVSLIFEDVVPALAHFELLPGMHLLTQPVITDAAALASRSRGLLSPVFYNAVERRYELGEGMPNGVIGKGFFIRNTAPLSLEAEGLLPRFLAPDLSGELLTLLSFGADELLTDGSPVGRQAIGDPATLSTLRLEGEWNLLGNPFGHEMPWNLEGFEVWVNGQRAGSLADPSTWIFVDPYGFVFTRDGYELVFDSSLAGFESVLDRVPELQGFWLRRTPSTNQVELRYQPVAAPVSPGARSGRSGSGGAWSVGLTASSGDDASQVTLGMAPGLGRALSIQAPPLAGEPAVDMVLLDGATRLAGQVLNRAGGSLSYTAEVTGRAGQDVTLTWQGIGRQLPAGYQATLTDLQSGQRLSMRTRSAYVYRSQGEARQFAIAIGRQSTAPLAVQVQAAPTRSRGASVSLVLNQPATVHLQVTSLSGRLVRQVSSQTAAAGATTLTWDGLDQSGRRVPAGLYQVLAIAESDQGEVARATTTVNVR